MYRLFILAFNVVMFFLKIFLFILLFAKIASANQLNETFLNNARVEGLIIYHTCILNPPKDASEVATCASLYAKYINSITLLNSPRLLELNTKPSLYNSVFDVCRYEISTLIFGEKTKQPYCPN